MFDFDSRNLDAPSPATAGQLARYGKSEIESRHCPYLVGEHANLVFLIVGNVSGGIEITADYEDAWGNNWKTVQVRNLFRSGKYSTQIIFSFG
jgi:hypothetical protein